MNLRNDGYATVGVCGFGASGSGAVIDLLKEFDDASVVDACELTLAYAPDGLIDLKYQLTDGSRRHMSSNTALHRFRRANKGGRFRYIRELTEGALVDYADELIDAVTLCSWIGNAPADQCYRRIRSLMSRGMRKYKLGWIYAGIEDRLGREVAIPPLGLTRFSRNPEGFDDAAALYVRRVVEKLGADFSRVVVLDQPFPANNPRMAFPFFEKPKAIVVDRDPRDCYLLVREYYRRVPGWRDIPTSTVEDFVVYYRGMREGAPYLSGDSGILVVMLEDLIYRYDATVAKVADFCGLSAHVRPLSAFNPAESVNNTQLMRDYPQYKREVSYIEEHLPEFLFPFEEFGDVALDRSKMFDEKPKSAVPK